MKKIIPVVLLLLLVMVGCGKVNKSIEREYRITEYGDTIYNPIHTIFGYITFQQLDTCTDTIMSNFYWPRQPEETFCHIADTIIGNDTIEIYYCLTKNCWYGFCKESLTASNNEQSVIEYFKSKESE